ncbi:hypothetical protein BHYA_0051g00010 [Botrytis hyacinthi]|uniref:NB-ARC domain-containing protein n=1 Tax=Botrytis hyacinthi TaxID=278943 RepID=A0A4Z1GWG6_9HELO|nr:hypothetical protein BHYA_0051g00010 [Botrytis hyacinthi]
MDSKRRFFKGLRREPREERANDLIGNGEPAPKVEIPKGSIADLISAASGSTAQHLYRLAPQTTNPTPINQKPVLKSGETLWSRAYTSLLKSNPNLLKTYETLLLNTNSNNLDTQGLNKQEQITAMVQNKQDMLESKQWTIKISGKSLKVKDQVKGIMEAFKKVKELGAALASIDPIIFGLPWAGVSFLLSVSWQFINVYDSKFHLRRCILGSKLLTGVTSEDEKYYKWTSLQDSRELRDIHDRINLQVSIQPSTITPLYFEVPTGRKIPHFIGRREILARVDSTYLKRSSSKAGVVVLRGLGGQGKTQIALKYCHVSRSKFEAMFWVDASSESSVIRSFEKIYAKIKRPGNDCRSGEKKLEFVKTTIRTWNFWWLIAFDNYDTPKTFSLEDYIPHSIHGSVLVTTRHKDVDALVENTAAAIELLGLPDKEALQLLYQQSGTKENGVNKIHGLSVERRLRYHALAITQTGVYIKNSKLDFSAFESHYSRRRKHILKYPIPMNRYTKSLSEFEKETALNVFTTWELSFDELEAQPKRTDLEKLLTTLAFFDPLDISEELFSTYLSCQLPWTYKYPGFAFCQREAGVWNRDAFADALQILESLSLIQSFHASTNGEYHISLHPLVKDWIRLRTEEALCEEYTVLVAEMIAFQAMLNLPEVDFVYLYAHEGNIGYITTPDVVEGFYDESQNKPSLYESFYFGELMIYRVLNSMQFSEKAKAIGGCLLERQKKFHWEDTWQSSFFVKEGIQDVLSILGMTEEAFMELLGRRLKEFGELEKALRLQRKVLEYNKKNRSDDNPILLKSLFKVAKTFIELGITEEAEQLYRTVVDLQVKLPEEAHVTTLKSKIKLAKILEKTTQTEEANKLCTEIFSFASTWAVLNSDEKGDAKIIDLIDDLGSTLENLNRYEDSLALSQQRLKLVEQYHSEEFFQLRSATVLVALYFQELNRFDEAEQFFFQKTGYCVLLRYLAKKEKVEELARDALQRLKEWRGEKSIEFRKWNGSPSLSWLHQTSKGLQDLDAYYDQVLGSIDDVTDEERYAAWRAWKVKVGEEVVIDAKKVRGFFSRYPAAISVGATDVKSALSAVAREASQPDSRERRRALIRHSNAYGDPFSICHCSAEVERLILLASIIEVMWIHDDVTEELDHGAACREHSALTEVLEIDVQPSDFISKNARQSALAAVLRKAIDLDPEKAPKMIETLRDYLATFDSRDDDFDRMEEYMPYRVANCGYWQQYDFTMGNILGLTNDYFSWNIEKNQTTDRIRNGVRVLIRQHNISPDAAKLMLLGLIVEEETKAARLKQERLERPVSYELSMYFEAIELYVGGSCFWHATAPRYRVFE